MQDSRAAIPETCWHEVPLPERYDYGILESVKQIGICGGQRMLCVIAKLNAEATEKLMSIRTAALSDAALKPLHGHITIASYTGNHEAQFVRFCKSLLERTSAFVVRYEKIEVLDASSIIVASPENSGALEVLHRRIAEEYNDSLNPWTQADRWYPHTTLLYEPNLDLHRICGEISGHFTPFSAQISRIEFSRVLESGYEIIDCVELTE